MYIAIIQDGLELDTKPHHEYGSTLEEVTTKICKYMYYFYNMPKHIVTLEDARNWISTNDKGRAAAMFSNIWWWSIDNN